MDGRVRDAFDLKKTFQEVVYLHHHCHIEFLIFFLHFWVFWEVQDFHLTPQRVVEFLQAKYLAEAVGAGMGSSLQGFMRRVFQG